MKKCGRFKEKKDENALKRPQGSFFLYQGERRRILKQEQPTLSNKDLMNLISEEWNNLDESKK